MNKFIGLLALFLIAVPVHAQTIDQPTLSKILAAIQTLQERIDTVITEKDRQIELLQEQLAKYQVDNSDEIEELEEELSNQVDERDELQEWYDTTNCEAGKGPDICYAEKKEAKLDLQNMNREIDLLEFKIRTLSQ